MGTTPLVQGLLWHHISQEVSSAIPTHAPSIHKGKKRILNRVSRSSSPPTLPSRSSPISKDDLEIVGLNAPKEPIRHTVLKASM